MERPASDGERRRSARRLAALARRRAAGSIAGVGGSAQRSAVGTVTLQFWSAYNVADKEASTMANVIIPKFEKENPGIKVVSVVYPYADLLQKYLAASAAGDPPDLLRSDIAWVPELAAQGLALKSRPAAWFSPIAKNALPGPLLTTHIHRGSRATALPLDTNTQALFWNKADFAAAGISGPPTTLTRAVRRRGQADRSGQAASTVSASTAPTSGTSAPYIWSLGGSFTNASYTKATGFMNSAATLAAVIAARRAAEGAGYIGSDFLGGASAVSGEQGFPKGQYAMYIDGPWAVATYAALTSRCRTTASRCSRRVRRARSRPSAARTSSSRRAARTSPPPRSSRSSSTRRSRSSRWQGRPDVGGSHDAAAEVKATPVLQGLHPAAEDGEGPRRERRTTARSTPTSRTRCRRSCRQDVGPGRAKAAAQQSDAPRLARSI